MKLFLRMVWCLFVMELYYSNLSINKYDDGIVFYNDNLLNAKNDDEELSMNVICSD